jgi:uncharacterized membrane protein YfcA
VLRLFYAPESAVDVWTMVEQERICCGFLTFELNQTSDAVCVTITAPEAARASVDVLFESFFSKLSASPLQDIAVLRCGPDAWHRQGLPLEQASGEARTVAGHHAAMYPVAALIACVSLLYATVRQAGGTAFLAIMTFAAFPADELRPTALLLNIVAAGYATWRLRRSDAIDQRMLLKVMIPSLMTAFAGGLLVLGSQAYFVLTGLLLIAAATLMMLKRAADTIKARPVRFLTAAFAGGSAGFLSGLTGVGGGVFLTPLLVVLGWASPRRAAALAPPFILCNSVVGLAGVSLAGQTLAPGILIFSGAALLVAVIGTAIGLRWMSERITRYVLAAILLFAGLRLLLR